METSSSKWAVAFEDNSSAKRVAAPPGYDPSCSYEEVGAYPDKPLWLSNSASCLTAVAPCRWHLRWLVRQLPAWSGSSRRCAAELHLGTSLESPLYPVLTLPP